MTSFKLHVACKKGDLELVKQLANAESCAQLNQQGFYPLDIAVYDYDCCKYLLETFKLDPFQCNPQDMNAVSYAIASNLIDVFQLMISLKGNYTKKSNKELICDTVCSSKDIQCAIDLVVKYNQAFSPDLLNIMLDYIGVGEINEALCRRLFFHTFRHDNYKILKYLLVENRHTKSIIEKHNLLNWHMSLNVQNFGDVIYTDANTTPLIYSVTTRKKEFLELLLSNSTIDVNLKNEPAATLFSLQAAVHLNDVETVKLLLQKGANKSIACNSVTSLQTAVMHRASFQVNNYNNTDAKKNFEIIKLLATNKKDVHEYPENGFNAFDYAIMQTLKDVIEYFVSIKGDLYGTKNGNNLAPIDYANEDAFRKYLEKTYKK